MALVTLPRQYTADINGEPRIGAKMFVYDAGTNNLRRAYTSKAYTIEHTQPIESVEGGLFPRVEVDPAGGDYKLVIQDVNGATIYTDDNITPTSDTLTAAGIGELLYPRTAAETLASVTPTNGSLAPYVRGRYASWSDWQLAADAGGAIGIVNQPYTLTADITLPLRSDFQGHVISGAFQMLFQNKSYGWIDNLHLNDVGASVRLSGCQQCRFDNFKVRKVFVDGFNNTIGYFWNAHRNWMVEECEVSITNFSVNANTWQNCVIRYFHTEGDTSVYAITDFNANKFDNVDFSDYGDLSLAVSGYVQNDSLGRKNVIQSAYYENGSDLTGAAHVLGITGDANGPPLIDRDCHILFNCSISQKNNKDFFAAAVVNQAMGGDWSIRDADNKPPCFSHSGGASVQVAADTTEPNGIGSRWQATFSDAFDQFNIAIRGSGQTSVGGYIYYKSTDDFVTVEVGDGSSTVFLSVVPIVLGNDWKLLRFCGPADPVNGANIVLTAYGATGGAAKTMSLGGVSAGTEQAVIPPQRPLRIHRYASATVNPASLIDGEGTVIATITVTGASLGDFVKASHGADLGGVLLQAWVSAANTVSYRFQNETGGTVDIASATLRVEVESSFA
jgi:hypothetical protein